MSIDFDSAALQTQHDEEEYDQEDYAREQELHKLLTDLPDDMLEDSRDSSSPELEYSHCSNRNTSNSPQSTWTQPWSNQPKPNSQDQNYEGDYDQDTRDNYAYENIDDQINGHQRPHSWNRPPEDPQFTQGDYTYTSMGTEKSIETNDLSVEYESKPYSQGINNHVEYNGEVRCRDVPHHGDHNSGKQFQPGAGHNVVNQHKAVYNPPHPAQEPQMYNPSCQDAQFDHLQREFLDSAQQTTDMEQLTQMQILNKALQRQIEDLERKLEDTRRNMRYIEHQFAIVRDEKDGLAVSLKESSRLVEEAKEREVQLKKKVKAMEQQIHVLTERDQENTKKQMVADAAVDSLKLQMLELCRSDTLSRVREQHDRDITIIKEQHEVALLALEQKLDSTSHALQEQAEVSKRLREQVKQLECQREEEQLERARVINGLTQRLEESQHQCAKLLQTNSVQEMSQMQIKLQQTQSAKELSENMNKVLQEDLVELKEQITLYESAVKYGVISLDLNSEWDNELSDSCVDLGLKKVSRKNGILHSPALAHLSDFKLPKDEAVRLLRVEMQRCLGSLKGKRQKIGQLQEELQRCQCKVNELNTQLEEAKLCSSVREKSQMKHLDMTGESHKELIKLQEDKKHLQEQMEVLEKKNNDLKQNEEKLKSSNLELCTKMREMIQELDQEKQEAAHRSERIHQQYRDDVVNRVKTELMLEHDAQVEQLTAQQQQQVQQLQTQLSEANDKMLAVQECYIAVCKEKDMLEERVHSREKEEASTREQEPKNRAESVTAVEEHRVELESQHQALITQLKSLWYKEEAEIQQHVISARAVCKEEVGKKERMWTKKLEEAMREKHRVTSEVTCQTDGKEGSGVTISPEELDSRLSTQKQQLQLEADKVKHKAVEEARKQTQRELQEKHLEDMAKQVEGAMTRAYNRWIEDLTSLPEYQASLQMEREKWGELQEKHIEQLVSKALKEAEEQWRKMSKNEQEQQTVGAERLEELQEEVVSLQSQLEQVRREQAALLKAELAGARAAWNREKQQEISIVQVRSEQVYQTKLQEQHKKLEQAEAQKKEMLLHMEVKLQETVRTREEEWRCRQSEREAIQRRQLREELLAELQSGMAQVQAQLLRDPRRDQQGSENARGCIEAPSEMTVTQILQTSCKDLVSRAISQAKKEWKKISEERLTRVIKETQELHERDMDKMLNSLSQRKESSQCRRECAESTSKLQRKNQELQKHLEKACRQFQHSVKEHKTTVQRLKEERESSLQKAKEEHLQELEKVKKAKEAAGNSDLQQGLEEMKQQYLMTVEKIRADMLRYLQESRERAGEMIRTEVLRERQDTARKMRLYYLTCLQELLEDGGKSTGAEKKIMNAASKLAAMAKVLETPVRSKSGKNFGLPNCSTAIDYPPGRNLAFANNPPTLPELPVTRAEVRKEKTSADCEQKQATRTKGSTQQDISGKDEASVVTAMKPHSKTPQQTSSSHHLDSPSHVNFVGMSARSKNRPLHLLGADNQLDSDGQGNAFPLREVPVRSERQSNWSMSSSDSDASFKVPRLSLTGKKVEPVKPFTASSVSAGDLGEFSGISPNASDATLYNDIAKTMPQTQSFPHGKMSRHREPTPGSEAEQQQHRVCSLPLFSELRKRQQDSGFDSTLYQQVKKS